MKRYRVHKLTNGMHGIAIPESELKSLAKQKRVRCEINNHIFHCALIKSKSGHYVIYLGKKTLERLNLKEGSLVSPQFSIDSAQYQFEHVPEWEAIVETDPEIKKIFHALTPGNQRSLLYLITQPKTEAKRIERAVLIAQRLKQGITSARVILKK